MKNPTKLLRKLVLAVAAILSLAAVNIASAAKVEFDIYLARYGWVIVKPGSNTGGAIRWDGSNYYTDRVNRGERLYIFEWPVAGEITGPNSAEYSVWCDSQSRYLVNWTIAPWIGSAWYEEFVVPTDPNKDNIYVNFVSNLGEPAPKRIPIGYRNP